MRVPQRGDSRGSLKWVKRLIGHDSSVLDEQIRGALKRDAGWSIHWVSPVPEDEWAEYRDGDFLERVGLSHLASKLSEFWPTRGPQWDALGVGSDGTVLLVEAKAHIGELASTCGAGARAKIRIEEALTCSKRAFGVPDSANWLEGYYQYANRLAHLHFLRENGVSACLLFLYFVGDREMRGPASEKEWRRLLASVYSQLGVKGDQAQWGVRSLFLDVAQIP